MNPLFKNSIFVFLLVALCACKKEPTSWQNDITAPIAHGHLTLEDIIPSQYLSTDAQNLYSIVYHEPVYTFTIDTLVKLPDTTIVKKSAISVSSITVNPGYSFADNYDQLYNLDQIEIKKVMVSQGEILVDIKCPWQGATTVKFSFPKITYQDNPFERVYNLPASTLSDPATANETIDISNYFLDLTGTDGNHINMLSAVFEMASNETTNSFNVSNTDSVEYNISFQNLKPAYAKGYFGQYLLADTVGFKLDFMRNITAGMIDLDSIDLSLTVKNGFNILAQSKINFIKGINSKTGNEVILTAPFINTNLNINPASGGFYDFVPSNYPVFVNTSNSNIIELIENLNDSIVLGYELNINPFGNTTGGSDEIFPGSKLELILNANYPLEVGADNLQITDTFKVDYKPGEDVYPENAIFELQYSNGFPIGASASIDLMNLSGDIIDTIDGAISINAGNYQSSTNLTTPTSGAIIFNVTSENLHNLSLSSHIILKITFNSSNTELVKINADAYLDFVLKTNVKLNISF